MTKVRHVSSVLLWYWQHRCVAVRLVSAHPHGISDIGDLIQSTEVYECFDGNAVEVEVMLDCLGTQHISPRHIWRG
jgi:E3 ubiquitin-protein ligase CHFR